MKILLRANALPTACCRENRQLRSEQEVLEQRLRLAGSASNAAAADGHAAHAAVAAAEAEVQATRQQAAAAQAQLAEAAAEAERARNDAQAAQAVARKLETDLEDLSAAYSTLDAHAGSLQQQLDALQAELAAARQQQNTAGAAAAAAAAGGGGVSEDEVEQRVAAAREEAAAEAQAEADEAMTDLLVCLGQEEAKVGRGGDGVCSLLPFRLCWMYMRLSGMDSPLPTIVAALVPFRWVALSSLSTGSNPTIYSLAAPFTFCSTM